MDALRKVANWHVDQGWTIVSIDDAMLVLSRKKSMSTIWLLLGFIGLLFAIIPGLLALLVGYVSRGEEQLIFSAIEAQEWLNKPKIAAGSWANRS